MSQSSFPGWATMGDNPSSSSVASDEEISPLPEPPPTAIRKRKGSPKASASQHKRPKAIHSATEPTPATKYPFGSSLKGKGRQRQKSLDSDSGSLDFDISAELEAGSSQKVASSSTSVVAPKPANKKWTRKSTGTTQAGQKTKNTGKPAFLSASASAPSQTHARKKTPNVHGQSLELSTDDDIPTPRRPATQSTKPIGQDDIIVIDSDSEPNLPPSKSRPTGPLSSKNNVKIPSTLHSHPSNPPAGFRMVDNTFELITSDEEDTVPPVRASGSGRPGSSVHAVLLPNTPARHARQSKSSTDELDISKYPSPKAAPVLKLATPPPPPSPIDMGMDVDFDRPFSPPENSSGARHISPLQKESHVPVHESSSPTNLERVTSVPIQTTESSKSPSHSIAQGTSLFGFPTGLSSVASTAIQPPLPADTVSQNDMPPDSPPRALAEPQSSVPASPVRRSLVRTPPPADNATRIPEPSTLTPEATKLSRPAVIFPPIRQPFQSQIRTEPSVPPHPAPNANDLGDRHHPPGSLFGFPLKKPVKARDLSSSASSSNVLTSDSHHLQTSTSAAAQRDSAHVDKEPVDASSGLQSNAVMASTPATAVSEGRDIDKGPTAAPRNKEVRKLVTSSPYRFPEGQSLSDVINRAYKPPPIHIDLTLDDSDMELVMDVPASVQHNAKLLDEFLASDNEETGKEDVVKPTGSNHDRLLPHVERLVMPSNSQENPRADPVGSAGVPVPIAKPRTNLDSIRSLIKKHQVQAKKTTSNPLSGNKVKAVAPVLPISLSAAQSSDTMAQPTSPPTISTKPDDGPSVVNALALLMPHDAEDVQMEDLPTTEKPPVVSQSESICNDDLSVNPPPIASTDQDDLGDDLDDIRVLRSRKQRVPLARASSSPDAEEVAFDLMYPESEGVATGSPLKNEITSRSSPDPSPPPLSTRTSSRLSSRSASSSSGDQMATTENDVEDDIDVDIYEPRSDNVVAADSPYITWRSVRRATRERPPKFLKAQNLPHALQDYVNALSPMYRKTDEARLIFEAAIKESTADDEPDAPPIEFHNKYDDEVTPPWEFHYTNKMWHGEGVPGPDMKSLQGCDCEGRCDPKSKTCLCVKKQSKYLDRTGFVYNDKGRLIDALHYPIFECNDFCGCGEECQNRVVQHGRKCIVNIVKTKDKGWGVFAGPKRIPAGTFVGIYSGELLTEAVGQERGLKYDIFGRTYLFNIDGYHLQQEDPNWEVSYVVDAYHAGNFTRFLNHSCEPNCMVTLCYINEGDKDKPLVTIFTQQDVEPWGELSFSYSGVTDEDIAIANRTDEGAVYAQCLCGAPGCRGVMFK